MADRKLSEKIVKSWTGATLKVTVWIDDYGRKWTDEQVVSLNTGDDDGSYRWRDDGEW